MMAQDKRAEAQINERLLAAWFDWLVASGYMTWAYMHDDMIRFMAEFRERYPLGVYGMQAGGTPPPPEPNEGINEIWREYAAAINDPPLSDEQKAAAFLMATASPPQPADSE